jgi:hypothetical protein
MKRIRILLASTLVAATCLVAIPQSSSAAPPPLTITCTPSPATCVAVGQLGPLFGVTAVSTQGVAALICLDASCSSGAILQITPGHLGAFAVLNNNVDVSLILTGHAVSVSVLTKTILLSLVGSNGAIGLLALTPGHTLCLGLDHLKLYTTGC